VLPSRTCPDSRAERGVWHDAKRLDARAQKAGVP
jgi:hypothetical protein